MFSLNKECLESGKSIESIESVESVESSNLNDPGDIFRLKSCNETKTNVVSQEKENIVM